MAHKPWISHDDAKRLIIKWHLMGLQWAPPQEISYDEGLGEEDGEETALGPLEDQ